MAGRRETRKRDPRTGRLLLPGIQVLVSDRTGAVSYRACLSWVDSAGVRHQERPTFRDAAEAESWLLDAQLGVRRGTRSTAAPLTVAAYWAQWLPRMRTRWKSSTVYHNTGYWERIIAPAIGPLPLAKVTRADCQRIIDRLVAEGYKGSTIRVIMAVVTGLFRAAVRDGLIPVSPALDLVYPTVERERPPTWSALQLRRFLDGTRETPLAPLWHVLATTGCRINEALALTWRDVHPETATLTIGRTVTRDEQGRKTIRKGTKGSLQPRTVPLDPATLALLLSMKGDAGPDAPVFAVTEGRARYHLARERARLGLPPLTLHGFRHTYISLHAALGTNPRLVADLVGHAKTTITLDLYTQASADALRGAAGALTGLVVASSATTDDRVAGLRDASGTKSGDEIGAEG